MKTWSFYDAAGTIVALGFTGTDDQLVANTPAGTTAIEGVFDGRYQRVVAGAVQDFVPPAPPDTSFITYTWDAATKQYVGHPTVAGNRALRAKLITMQIGRLEDGQIRLLRELLIVVTTGLVPTLAQITALKAADADVAALRASLLV